MDTLERLMPRVSVDNYEYTKNNPLYFVDIRGLACAPKSDPCPTPDKLPKFNDKYGKIYQNRGYVVRQPIYSQMLHQNNMGGLLN